MPLLSISSSFGAAEMLVVLILIVLYFFSTRKRIDDITVREDKPLSTGLLGSLVVFVLLFQIISDYFNFGNYSVLLSKPLLFFLIFSIRSSILIFCFVLPAALITGSGLFVLIPFLRIKFRGLRLIIIAFSAMFLYTFNKGVTDLLVTSLIALRRVELFEQIYAFGSDTELSGMLSTGIWLTPGMTLSIYLRNVTGIDFPGSIGPGLLGQLVISGFPFLLAFTLVIFSLIFLIGKSYYANNLDKALMVLLILSVFGSMSLYYWFFNLSAYSLIIFFKRIFR